MNILNSVSRFIIFEINFLTPFVCGKVCTFSSFAL